MLTQLLDASFDTGGPDVVCVAHQQPLLTFTLRYDRKRPGLIRDVNIQA